MKSGWKSEAWLRLLCLLCLLLPLVILFLLPGGEMISGIGWFWLLLLLCFLMSWMMLGRPESEEEPVRSCRLHAENPEFRALAVDELPRELTDIMQVRFATASDGARIFRGPLRVSGDQASARLNQAFGQTFVPLVQQDEQFGSAIVLLPKVVDEATMERPVRWWLHGLLFVLTIFTTTLAGAAHQGVNLLVEPARFAVGLPYSIGLLLILGLHELGHYFAARYHGMSVTPPFFIPVPFGLGTFGAFIQMRSPAENRRALFDVAVAGPLAGLVPAIPALWIGLQSSTVIVETPGAETAMGGASVGSSLLFAALSKLALGDALQFGHSLQLSPLAFAGWLGLFITALNLLPIGQLDGGHIARAVFGHRTGSSISTVAMWSLFLLALFVWPGLMMWAVLVFFLAGQPTPPLNDVTDLNPVRKAIGYLSFAILAAILLPLPHAFWSRVGIHCPYL
jgi:membrane-associated protease RseP (regulator of RpoE activity)